MQSQDGMDEAGPNIWILLLVQKAHFCTDREKMEKKKEAQGMGGERKDKQTYNIEIWLHLRGLNGATFFSVPLSLPVFLLKGYPHYQYWVLSNHCYRISLTGLD